MSDTKWRDTVERFGLDTTGDDLRQREGEYDLPLCVQRCPISLFAAENE